MPRGALTGLGIKQHIHYLRTTAGQNFFFSLDINRAAKRRVRASEQKPEREGRKPVASEQEWTRAGLLPPLPVDVERGTVAPESGTRARADLVWLCVQGWRKWSR